MRTDSPSSKSEGIVRLAFLIVVPLVWALVPISLLERAPRVCLLRRMGLPCWGCGMTRAIASALRGDWQGAWRYNRLSVIVGPLLAYLWSRALIRDIERV
ncbi:MAG TPA: DUF2752 domain-containing protein [Thermoanaerobaculia bacterium]